jgi:DNA-binding NarL/FixJ family response regulator
MLALRRMAADGQIGLINVLSGQFAMAIHAALKGQTFITPALASDVLRQVQHESREMSDSASPLTPRQREILQLLAEGRSAKEIAATLAISARTVEFHKYQMMEAHGLHSSAELIHFAIKHGIVTI